VIFHGVKKTRNRAHREVVGLAEAVVLEADNAAEGVRVAVSVESWACFEWKKFKKRLL